MVRLRFALFPCFLKSYRQFVISDSFQAINDCLILGIRIVGFHVCQKRNQLRLFLKGKLPQELSKCFWMLARINSGDLL